MKWGGLEGGGVPGWLDRGRRVYSQWILAVRLVEFSSTGHTGIGSRLTFRLPQGIFQSRTSEQSCAKIPRGKSFTHVFALKTRLSKLYVFRRSNKQEIPRFPPENKPVYIAVHLMLIANHVVQ